MDAFELARERKISSLTGEPSHAAGRRGKIGRNLGPGIARHECKTPLLQ